MATCVIIDVIPEGGGRLAVQHVFYGATEEEAREVFRKHAAGCEFLGPAMAEDRIDEQVQTIDDDEWPEYDEDGRLFGDDGDEEEDEEPEPEEE